MILIEVQTKEECEAVCEIIDKMNGLDSILIDPLKSAVECYRIRNMFDFIGPMSCPGCKRTWTAIFPKAATKLECPNCSFMVEIPKQEVKSA